MNAEIENLVLEQLRAIPTELGDLRREVRTELSDIRQRVSSIERNTANQQGQLANLQGDVALTHQRLDHLGERPERIERRLDLSEAPA